MKKLFLGLSVAALLGSFSVMASPVLPLIHPLLPLHGQDGVPFVLADDAQQNQAMPAANDQQNQSTDQSQNQSTDQSQGQKSQDQQSQGDQSQQSTDNSTDNSN